MTKHTPGPWYPVRLDERAGAVPLQYVISCQMPDIILVAGIDNGLTATEAEKQANAHLIAAAPDLLEALKRAEEYVDDYLSMIDVTEKYNNRLEEIRAQCRADLQFAREAIAKAEGKSDGRS